MFVPTATMANEIALRVLGEPGDELIAEENAHILIAELGGRQCTPAIMTQPCPPRPAGSRPTRCARRRAAATSATCRRRIVAIENTHNSSGGRVWPLAEIEAMADTPRARAEPAHRRRPPLQRGGRQRRRLRRDCGTRRHRDDLLLQAWAARWARSWPASAERMLRARRFKHQFGGAMRQAGDRRRGLRLRARPPRRSPRRRPRTRPSPRRGSARGRRPC